MNCFTPRRPGDAVSNTERQRQFRERNPGYYGRLRRKQKAEQDARMPQYSFATAFMLKCIVPESMPLMLPAPAEPLVFEFTNSPARELEPVAISRPISESIARRSAA